MSLALQETEHSKPKQQASNGWVAHLDTNVAFKGLWFIWRLTGIECPANIHPLIYYIYALCLHFIETFTFTLSLLVNLRYTKTIVELCDALSITISDIMAVLKFVNVFRMRGKMREIKEIVRDLDTRLSSVDEQHILHETVRHCQRLFRTFAVYYVGAVMSSIVRPYFNNERALMYPGYFNLDWRNSNLIYAIIFIYQTFCLSAQTFQLCASDACQAIYLSVLTGYMRALSLRVERIGTDEKKNDLEFCEDELKQCIKMHKKILHLHDVVQETLSATLLAQVVGSTIVQCISALHFLFNMDDHNVSALVLSLFFFSAFTLELFIVCYYAQVLSTQSEAILQAFYSSQWMDQKPSYKSTLLITLQRTQKPSELYAGNYFKVDLETFVKVMKFAYSTFTLLLRFR